MLCDEGAVQLRIVAMLVGVSARLIAPVSASVPVLTDQRSTPQPPVGVGEGVGVGVGVTEQSVAGELLLRGMGEATTKSCALLSVSVQPLATLTTAVVLLGAAVAVLPIGPGIVATHRRAIEQQRRDRLAELPGELAGGVGLAVVDLGAFGMQRHNTGLAPFDLRGHVCLRLHAR